MPWSETQILICNFISRQQPPMAFLSSSYLHLKTESFFIDDGEKVQSCYWFLLTAVFLLLFSLMDFRNLLSWWNDFFQKDSRANVLRSKMIVTLVISQLTNNHVSTMWTSRPASYPVSYLYHLKCTLNASVLILNTSFKYHFANLFENLWHVQFSLNELLLKETPAFLNYQ